MDKKFKLLGYIISLIMTLAIILNSRILFFGEEDIYDACMRLVFIALFICILPGALECYGKCLELKNLENKELENKNEEIKK